MVLKRWAEAPRGCAPASGGWGERGTELPVESAISTSISVGTHLERGPEICPSWQDLGNGHPSSPPPQTVQG